jgi:hypothetical protein
MYVVMAARTCHVPCRSMLVHGPCNMASTCCHAGPHPFWWHTLLAALLAALPTSQCFGPPTPATSAAAAGAAAGGTNSVLLGSPSLLPSCPLWSGMSSSGVRPSKHPVAMPSAQPSHLAPATDRRAAQQVRNSFSRCSRAVTSCPFQSLAFRVAAIQHVLHEWHRADAVQFHEVLNCGMCHSISRYKAAKQPHSAPCLQAWLSCFWPSIQSHACHHSHCLLQPVGLSQGRMFCTRCVTFATRTAWA